MFKAMILLTRREDMTPDDFRRWWLEEHRPLALQLPGLRRMVVNIVEPGPGHDETGIDGVSELWFDTQADFEAAYATEIGKAVAADSTGHNRRRVRLFIDEHEATA
jgi:uncharacterized protein (TIGR02118 family)